MMGGPCHLLTKSTELTQCKSVCDGNREIKEKTYHPFNSLLKAIKKCSTKDLLLKVFMCLSQPELERFPQLCLMKKMGGEIDHQGRNNLEISAKALFFSC